MTLSNAISELNILEKTMHAYRHAMGVLSLDSATCAPAASAPARGETMGVLGEASYKLLVNPRTEELLQTLREHSGDVDATLRRRVEVLWDAYQDTTRIPMDEYVDYTRLCTQADAVWHKAKEESDFASFAPYLEKLVAYNRRFAGYKSGFAAPYDALLDDYEKGATMAVLDPYFETLRARLTPLIRAVAEKPAPRTDFFHLHYPLEDQRRFSQRLMALMGLDPDRCVIGETEHPFTDGFNRWDVRITTHYQEYDVSSSMYSVIHEGGHALYELGIGEDLQFTCLADGASMGLHESQSRFYENLIGRSLPFCKALLPVMQACFPEQMRGVDAQTLYRAVNVAQPSLIRTEADELTYPLHIMIRYELEKRLIAGDMRVAELPEAWNAMYREYLGVEVPNDRQGVLQDSHWSGGSFGYFPSYALGSAYGAQMLERMEREIDVWGPVERGDLRPVTAWLGEKLHRYGKLLTPAQALESVCGAPFDPECYVNYLTRKYTALYNL